MISKVVMHEGKASASQTLMIVMPLPCMADEHESSQVCVASA